MHAEYGIVVYPSAITDDIDPAGLGVDKTFTEAYVGHIGESGKTSKRESSMLTTDAVMFGRCNGTPHPPPCPFEYLQEPPPVYEKDAK